MPKSTRSRSSKRIENRKQLQKNNSSNKRNSKVPRSKRGISVPKRVLEKTRPSKISKSNKPDIVSSVTLSLNIDYKDDIKANTLQKNAKDPTLKLILGKFGLLIDHTNFRPLSDTVGGRWKFGSIDVGISFDEDNLYDLLDLCHVDKQIVGKDIENHNYAEDYGAKKYGCLDVVTLHFWHYM